MALQKKKRNRQHLAETNRNVQQHDIKWKPFNTTGLNRLVSHSFANPVPSRILIFKYKADWLLQNTKEYFRLKTFYTAVMDRAKDLLCHRNAIRHMVGRRKKHLTPIPSLWSPQEDSGLLTDLP